MSAPSGHICTHTHTLTVELLMLLKWRQKPQDLGVALTNLMCVDGEEVVKFLQDTLDCLFEILNTNQDVYGLKVFDVLVSEQPGIQPIRGFTC